jgi:hypothetical protein
MPPELLRGAVSMQEECKEFLGKTKQFNDIVGDFIEVMESKSKVRAAAPELLAPGREGRMWWTELLHATLGLPSRVDRSATHLAAGD